MKFHDPRDRRLYHNPYMGHQRAVIVRDPCTLSPRKQIIE